MITTFFETEAERARNKARETKESARRYMETDTYGISVLGHGAIIRIPHYNSAVANGVCINLRDVATWAEAGATAVLTTQDSVESMTT